MQAAGPDTAETLTWRRKIAPWALPHCLPFALASWAVSIKSGNAMNEFRIVVIGAGETGTPLLKQLLTSPFVNVLGVADLNLELPGIALALEHEVPVTDNFMDLVRQGAEVDIIIDVTGAPKVREQLRQHMVDSHNTHTIIMHEHIALLMMSLSAGKMIDSKHGHQQYA